MAGRNPSEAAKAFLDPIQEALSCFLDGHVQVTTYDAEVPGTLMLNGGEQTPVFGSGSLTVQVSIQYSIIHMPEDEVRGPWKVRTEGWIHTLHEGEAEILGYHWHPVDTPDVLHPHFHFNKSKEHLPSGRILVEDVLRAAMEYGAVPRDRDTWEVIDERNRQSFLRGATWGAGPVVEQEDDAPPLDPRRDRFVAKMLGKERDG